ncbi:hypothetical protein Hanom_Chr04g00354871 [Helianthus anomalus]
MIEKIIFGSSVLETLALEHCYGYMLLNIISKSILFHHVTPAEEAQEEMLTGLIRTLLHVKDIKIGTSCSKVLDRLKAKGLILPSNLKVFDNGLTCNIAKSDKLQEAKSKFTPLKFTKDA